MKLFSTLIAFFLLPIMSAAATTDQSVISLNEKKIIQKLSDTYFNNLESLTSSSFAQTKSMDCSESSTSMHCVKYICELNFKCSKNDMMQAVKACRGNSGSSCLRYICGIKHSCAFYEMISAANACKANTNTDCIKYICELNYNCSFDGILQAAKICGGTDEIW